MPIEVKHGVGGGLAALAAIAGALSGGQRGGSSGGGGGGRGGHVSIHGATSMMPRGKIGPGRPTLEEQMRLQMEYEGKAQRFGMEAELEQQRREMEAQWQSQYTAKQKQEIARVQNGIEQARKSGNFSEEEMAEVERMGSMRIMGISPTLTPKDDGQKQMEAWAAEGKGIGQEWVDDWGNVKTREADGTIKTQAAYDKTRIGQEAKLQREREKDLAESRLRLEKETVKGDGLDAKETARYRPIEIEAMLERAYPWYREQQIQREAVERQAAMEQIVEQQQMAAQQEQRELQNWPVHAREKGIDVQEVDLDLPPQAGMAQAYIRTMNARYGGYDGVPKDKRTAYLEAYGILRQAQGQMRQEVAPPGDPAAQPSQRTWEPTAAPTPEFGF